MMRSEREVLHAVHQRMEQCVGVHRQGQCQGHRAGIAHRLAIAQHAGDLQVQSLGVFPEEERSSEVPLLKAAAGRPGRRSRGIGKAFFEHARRCAGRPTIRPSRRAAHASMKSSGSRAGAVRRPGASRRERVWRRIAATSWICSVKVITQVLFPDRDVTPYDHATPACARTLIHASMHSGNTKPRTGGFVR